MPRALFLRAYDEGTNGGIEHRVRSTIPAPAGHAPGNGEPKPTLIGPSLTDQRTRRRTTVCRVLLCEPKNTDLSLPVRTHTGVLTDAQVKCGRTGGNWHPPPPFCPDLTRQCVAAWQKGEHIMTIRRTTHGRDQTRTMRSLLPSLLTPRHGYIRSE